MACDAILFVSRLIQKYLGENSYTYVWSLHICFCTDSFWLLGWIMHAHVQDVFLRHPVFNDWRLTLVYWKPITVYGSHSVTCHPTQGCIDVSMELLCRTWWTVVHSQQKSLAVNICVLPLSGSWSYRAIDWTVSVVGAFLWQARRLGIRCQTVFVTQNWVSILSNVSWRHTFLRNIDDKMY